MCSRARQGAEGAIGFVAPGDVVDNCRIDDLLGAGGFGAVFRAYHLSLESPRALKFMLPRPDVAKVMEEMKERFLNEARHTAALSHPNIVIVHNVGEHNGMPFINMEYLHGASLRSFLAEEGLSLSLEEMLRVTDQVLSALGWAHEKGFVHRDVKPDNVMVLESGTVKVVDFGLSLNVAPLSSRVTQDSGRPMGTPFYMAPEQWETSTVGPPADVWSVGVMLYEMLAGNPPFGGRSIMELCASIRERPHPPLARLLDKSGQRPGAGVPSAVSALVDRMLDKSPARRPRDAGEARRLLREAVAVKRSAVAVDRPTMKSTSFISATEFEGLETLPAEADGADRFRRTCDGSTMLLFPEAEFVMGSDRGDIDERPARRVTLSPFLMDEGPVTRLQYAIFLGLWGSDRDDEGHRLLDPDVACLEQAGTTWMPTDGDMEPVTGVTWYGAAAYAGWAGMSLPSEAQIEYAMSCVAESESASSARLRQLVGTVRHWCADTYDEGFYGRGGGEDPVNVEPGAFVAVRGLSSIMGPAGWSRSRRQFDSPREMAIDLGFRCARKA